jgi:hypothetical protein
MDGSRNGYNTPFFPAIKPAHLVDDVEAVRLGFDQEDVGAAEPLAAPGDGLDEPIRHAPVGDGELVLDRARLLLVDLGGQQVAVMRWGSCWRLTAVVMISSKAAFIP